MQTKTNPKFSKGDRVYNLSTKDFATVAAPARWNGLTYMYSFEGEEVRCGEEYLRPLKPRQQSSEAVDILRAFVENATFLSGTTYGIDEKHVEKATQFLNNITD